MANANILIINCSEKDISSVDAISNNLVEDYKKRLNCEVLELKDSKAKLPFSENFNLLLEKIKQSPPQKIIVTHPAVFRSAFFLLLIQLLQNKNVEYVFHLYGDFIRQAKRWIVLEKYLINKKILFVTPSRAYLSILEVFFKNPEVLMTVPFSINEEAFSFKSEGRKRIRENYKIGEEELVFIYAGRLSLQKNVLHLVKMIKKFKGKLFIIGNEDDFEGGTVGESQVLGSHYESLKKFYSDPDIYFIDNMERESLVSYLSAADIFISLSLFHDEDFGRAPLEALMTGTPVILSNWGGYQAYHEDKSPYSKLLSVKFQNESLLIENDLTDEDINQLRNISREDCQKYYAERFSQSTISDLIDQKLRSNFEMFQGFTEVFHRNGLMKRNYFYDENNELISSNYLQVYEKFGGVNAK